MSRSYYYEQGVSLAEELVKAGVQHGDFAQVDMVVGVRNGASNSQLCFCSIEQLVASVIKPGSSETSLDDMPTRVDFNRRARRQIRRRLSGRHGFARISCTVRTNGSINISQLKIRRLYPASLATAVNQSGSYSRYRLAKLANI